MKKYHIFVYNIKTIKVIREAFITDDDDFNFYLYDWFTSGLDDDERIIYKEVNDKNAVDEYEIFDDIIKSND